MTALELPDWAPYCSKRSVTIGKSPPERPESRFRKLSGDSTARSRSPFCIRATKSAHDRACQLIERWGLNSMSVNPAYRVKRLSSHRRCSKSALMYSQSQKAVLGSVGNRKPWNSKATTCPDDRRRGSRFAVRASTRYSPRIPCITDDATRPLARRADWCGRSSFSLRGILVLQCLHITAARARRDCHRGLSSPGLALQFAQQAFGTD
jgi:hypothetical protein